MAINKKSIRLNQVPLNAHVGRNIMLVSLMLILLGIHLQYTQEYLFYFRETLMVFYYDASIIASRYFGIGGPGLLLTHWITQFFILKYGFGAACRSTRRQSSSYRYVSFRLSSNAMHSLISIMTTREQSHSFCFPCSPICIGFWQTEHPNLSSYGHHCCLSAFFT